MKIERMAALLIAGILMFGCIQPPGGSTPTDKPVGEIVKEDVASPTIMATVTPLATPTAESTVAPTTLSTPIATLAATITPSVANVQEFTTETDDNGWYPNSITVKAGVPLVIHNTLRTTNVYFGGARIQADVLPQPITFGPGDKKDIAFTPETSVCLGTYWPSSNVLKGYLKVNVDGQAPASC